MPETQQEKTNEVPPVVNAQASNSGNIWQSWKVRAGLIGTALISVIVGLFLVVFFWHHSIAGIGMRSWASHAGASPIECMIKDTNNDGYVSCSAMLQGEVVPLECGASLFNIGCRVNYGAAAAPPVRLQSQSNVRGRS